MFIKCLRIKLQQFDISRTDIKETSYFDLFTVVCKPFYDPELFHILSRYTHNVTNGGNQHKVKL